MKAVVWKDIDKIEYTDIPEPSPQKGWVKIKVMAVGLCATEVALINGSFTGAVPPHVLGHEVCGNIVEVGEGCDSALIGRRVVVETYVGCGECEFCKTGRKHLCSAGEIGYPPYNGGDAQYTVVPAGCVRFIPDNITYDEGAIMEAVACPFGALMQAGVGSGHTVLVQGAGIAGLSFVQGAKALGAERVFCTVRNDIKAEIVKNHGGEIIDTRMGDVKEQIMEKTDGMGADFCIDALGSSRTVKASFDCVKSGGNVILYGIPNKDDKIELPVLDCILRQISVTGYTGNEKCWDPMIKLISEGKIVIRDLVSATFPLSRFADALALLRSGRSDVIKTVLHPWEQ